MLCNGLTRDFLSLGHRKKMSLTNSDDMNVSALNTDQNDQENCYDITEDVLVFSLGVTNECPGMLPESKVSFVYYSQIHKCFEYSEDSSITRY